MTKGGASQECPSGYGAGARGSQLLLLGRLIFARGPHLRPPARRPCLRLPLVLSGHSRLPLRRHLVAHTGCGDSTGCRVARLNLQSHAPLTEDLSWSDSAVAAAASSSSPRRAS